MRPPESAPNRARDIFGSISLGVMQSMAGGPGGRRAGSVEHREEDQHAARPWIQRERSMRNCAMIPDRGAQSAEEHQRHRAEKYVPSGKRVKDEADSGGNMNE